MSYTNPLHKDLIKIVISALMALFLVPLTAWFFVRYALPSEAAIEIAEPFTPLWQFQIANQVAGAALIAGIIMLLVLCALGAAAFTNRQVQYLSFVTGWQLLRLFCAIEVLAQGTLLVWLAFWLTAFFGQVYFPKLIGLAAIFAAASAFYAIVCIFQRVPQTTNIEGEVIDEILAPALWAHVRKLSAEAGTAPPDHIVAGNDANFFVTETPLHLKERTLSGRSLFVSLPLLRLLNRTEANAVLMHELAHFRGGDTASSAKLGPKLAQYDYYCAMMHTARIPAFYVLCLYRVIFEFALKRDSRDREFLADRVAATLVSAQGIIRALIKISAYTCYRDVIEQKLFAEEGQHSDQIGIADRVAKGLKPYAESAQFIDEMQAASIPHPFDTHPGLRERMHRVGYEVRELDYSQIVTQPNDSTWIIDIQNADAIEQALWEVYENRFAMAHEQQLAYRYLPATASERAIVLKYFPTIEFELRDGNQIVISYDGLMLPREANILSWDKVADMKYEEGLMGDILSIIHPEKGWFGDKTTKVKLPGIGKQRSQLKATLEHYWQRHWIMRNGLNSKETGQ
ncbi:MAG: M48 family metalloprotease [Synechococcales bacterium]|nr:M48 family metalloprotease [Synechococcales bacterium]